VAVDPMRFGVERTLPAPADPAAQAQPSPRHQEGANGTQRRHDLERRALEIGQRQLAVVGRRVAPDHKRLVVAIELVSQSSARRIDVDELPGEKGVDDLRSKRSGAANPALAFLGVAPDQAAARAF
jgi:hypothetical protein